MNDFERILGISFPKGIKISHATNTSKKAKKDSIFFGLKGTKDHGSKYIDEAIKLGASIAVHNDEDYKYNSECVFYIKDLEDPIKGSKTKIYQFLETLYQMPRDFKPAYYGFTGTNGKSSAAFLCHQLIRKIKPNSLYVGTLGFQYNNEEFNSTISSKTTPDIFELFEIFSICKFNISYISIEVSSHALDQDRLKDIRFLYSAILNIEIDHLDYHKNINEYAKAKFKILNMTNGDVAVNDQISIKHKDYLDNYDGPFKLISVGDNDLSDITFNILESDIYKTKFTITNGDTVEYTSSLFPKFNVNNLVFALLPMMKDPFFLTDNINDLSFLKLPKGRTEIIAGLDANIIIDYAHNPNGIKFFLESIKDYFDNLIVVLGCGGNRDKSKRSDMLKIAIENSKKVIFTSDNPRNESFDSIYSDASRGNNIDNVKDIEDRKKAIIYGSKLIGDNDCLVILGKGHEETQEVNGKFIHFSDHEVVNEIYK